MTLLAQAVSGVEVPFPPPADYLATWLPQVAAGLGGPGSAGFATWAGAVQQRSGGDRPGFDVALASWATFLLALAQPEPGAPAASASNLATLYQLDSNPGVTEAERSLNAAVARVDRDDFLADAGRVPVPPVKGKPTVPVLTLHTIGDFFVPFSMQQVYARRTTVNGTADLLVQRAVRDVGHCTFSEAELERAMADLVSWALEGTVPLGDDVLDPAVVASPDYGCRFTDTRGEFTGTEARAAFAPCVVDEAPTALEPAG